MRAAFRPGFERGLHRAHVLDAVEVQAAVDHDRPWPVGTGVGVAASPDREDRALNVSVLGGATDRLLRELLVDAGDDVPRLLLRRQREPAGVECFPGGGADPAKDPALAEPERPST